MPVRVNLRLLEIKPAELTGQLDGLELAEGFNDELFRFENPMSYDLTVTRQPQELFVEGTWQITLRCTCSRCLDSFDLTVENDPMTLLIPLTGEEAAPRDGDFADLTSYLREDTFLALPTHPLCNPECRGLSPNAVARDSRIEGLSSLDGTSETSGLWDALDKLKL
jgi:uncharacterized metal-binding protein YceD (DUF177 family)